MSDKPEGPGWWIASDGQWYPPELHPSVRADSPDRAGATPEGTETRSAWSGPERRSLGDRRQAEDSERVGPQFPDLFQKALQGSHLADNVSVRYDDDRDEAGSAGSRRKVGSPTGGSTGGGSGTAAKRRWRKGS